MKLKEILTRKETRYALEAHNGISAKIVEQAGFEIIWASGLTISTSLGHRDCNELSWTNVCDIVEYMVDATNIPILVDGDTGFGNFNNVRELVKKLSKYGAAGVSLEDKTFPKTNSFLPHFQPLCSIDHFCGKVKAAKDSQSNDDFCVIARTEAFIVGNGVDDALERAHAYIDAGADAILVHSKKEEISEIRSFVDGWNNKAPLVLVPTTYHTTPSKVYEELGVSLVIWANHLLRTSISAMRKAAHSIYQECSPSSFHPQMTSVQEIFDLVNEPELKKAREIYESK